MKRFNRRHKYPRSRGKEKEASISHSDKQRETLLRGLRILARLIVRAHLRRRQSSVYQVGEVDKSKNDTPI